MDIDDATYLARAEELDRYRERLEHDLEAARYRAEQRAVLARVRAHARTPNHKEE